MNQETLSELSRGAGNGGLGKHGSEPRQFVLLGAEEQEGDLAPGGLPPQERQARQEVGE